MEAVVSKVIHELQQKASITNEQRLSAHTRELRAELALASAFKKSFDSLILREMIQRPQTFNPTEHKGESGSEKVRADGRGAKIPLLGGSNDACARAVLTLYGSAPQPKQLFSSLQQPLGIESKFLKRRGNNLIANSNDDSNFTTILAPSRDSIREPALPNGISVTKVIPVHSTNSSDRKQKKTPTLGELFPPPPNLAPLQPPKISKHTATRSSSVSWYNPSEPAPSGRPSRRESYSNQSLTTGQWLTYNTAPPSTQLSPSEAKRKQRDRALSFGEPQSTIPQEVVIAHNQAKEDALFRSVYSSFAPDRDNAGALISDHIKNRYWWKRYGENRFQDVKKASHASLSDGASVEVNGNSEHGNSADEDEFKGLLDDWMPEELPPELKPTPKVVRETPATTEEVDEILQGISDLLETLNSYQRNRNLSLVNNARTMPNSQQASTSGSPTSPSSAEYDVFTMLQSQLALMVSTLPPYALAKLDGDKLGVLNISTKIQIQDKQYTGTMEEDEILAKAKQATATPATSYSSRNVSVNSSVPPRSSSYLHAPSTPSQPVQRPNYATQPRPVNTPSSYLPNQQYSSRPASSNHYFSGTSHPSYSQRPTATTSERYSYSASQQYSQRSAQSSQIPQGNGYRSYAAQNGQSYSQQYSTPQQGASSTSGPVTGAHTQRPSQPGYQQRAMNAQSYNANAGSSSARDGSPPKPSATFTPQHQRTSYTGQGQIPSQQRPQLYHQHSAQYGSQTPMPRQVNGAGATPNSSQHTYMTAEEQSALMNRQKAQLAEQGSAPRQGSGTPQPANGHYSGPHNGTPAVQPNGVTVGQGQ